MPGDTFRASCHPGTTTGVVAALPVEGDCLTASRIHPGILERLPSGTLLWIAGIGPGPAMQAAHALIDAHCTALVSWGIAGALNPELAPGSVVVPSRVITSSGTAYATEPSWRQRIVDICRCWVPVMEGELICSDQIVSTVTDKAALWRHSGAAAVDMESAAVAAVAAEAGVPFLAIRAVADLADEILPAFVLRSLNPWGRPRIMPLAAGLLRCRLTDLGMLWQLSRHFGAARQALTVVATQLGAGFLAPEQHADC